MASHYTHLAIAKRYLEKHKGEIKDEQAFYNGSLITDLWLEPNSHYHDPEHLNIANLVERHKGKSSPKQCLEINGIDDDFNRAKFLHIHADWVFYNEFFSHEYLLSTDIQGFAIDNLYTSAHYDDYLREKYGISYGLTTLQNEVDAILAKYEKSNIERFGAKTPQGNIIYSADELNDFIEQISSSDIDKLAQFYTEKT